MKRLNIGCGADIKPKEEGWVNLDHVAADGVDVVWDLDKKPYPFEDETFDLIYAEQILDHVSSLNLLFEEARRILKKKERLR